MMGFFDLPQLNVGLVPFFFLFLFSFFFFLFLFLSFLFLFLLLHLSEGGEYSLK